MEEPQLEPSVPLAGLARTYWDRHAQRLREVGLLTDCDTEAFTLTCQLWSRLQALQVEAEKNPSKNRPYLDTCKAWQSMARQFSLLPLERKRAGVELTRQVVDEYGIPQDVPNKWGF